MDQHDFLKPPMEDEVLAWEKLRGNDAFREQIAYTRGLQRGTYVFGKTVWERLTDFTSDMGWTPEYLRIVGVPHIQDKNYIILECSGKWAVRPRPSLDTRKSAIMKFLTRRYPDIHLVIKACNRLGFTVEETFRSVCRWCKHEGILTR